MQHPLVLPACMHRAIMPIFIGPQTSLENRALKGLGSPLLMSMHPMAPPPEVLIASTIKFHFLDIYGPYNMQLLGVGVPGKDFSNISDVILEELSLLPARGSFGYLSYDGHFKLTELNYLLCAKLCPRHFLSVPHSCPLYEYYRYIILRSFSQ